MDLYVAWNEMVRRKLEETSLDRIRSGEDLGRFGGVGGVFGGKAKPAV
jgi:hypothetical protein